MLFTITAKHIKITEAIKNYAEEKTSRLPKYYNSINKIEVIIDGGGGNGGNISVEIIASGEHNKIFVVHQTAEDAYKCIDIAMHKLERQIRRKKGKERDSKFY